MKTFGCVSAVKPEHKTKAKARSALPTAKNGLIREDNLEPINQHHSDVNEPEVSQASDMVPGDLVDKLYHDFAKQLEEQKKAYEERIEALEAENKFASDTLGKEAAKMMAEYNKIKQDTLNLISDEIAVSGTLETRVGKELIKKNEQLRKAKKKPSVCSSRINELSKPKTTK